MLNRLSKVLADAGLASRRGSERLILAGRVSVNGETVTSPGGKVDPHHDRIVVDGHPLPPPEPKRYLLLHKPRGYLTSRSDPKGRATVTDLVGAERGRLFPVGRLDLDAQGLLLLTNDGELAQRLLHPRFQIPRVYEVEVRGRVSTEELAQLKRGVILEDGPARPSDVRLLRRGVETTWLRLTFTEGRYHEVKRLCQAIGHRVVTLRRTAFGPLRLMGLRPGEMRALTPRELNALRGLPHRR
jgi:pseudouridine synthase